MRRYKKKASNDAYGYVPQSGSQAEMIEKCLSRSEWKTVKEITQQINRNDHKVDPGRVRQHLNHHVKTNRLETRDT